MVILHDSMHASVDASDLSLPPGQFPTTLTVEVPERGQVRFQRAGMHFTRGSVTRCEYEADDGFELVVFND